MAAFDLQEQEQIAALKGWWEGPGKILAGVLAAALFAYAGWNGWEAWQKREVAKAAEIYTQIEHIQLEDGKFKASVAQLKSEYTSSPYSARAALLAAKLAYVKGDVAGARSELTWVIQNAKEAALRDAAKLRQAAISLEDHKLDEALALVKTPEDDGFSALFAEMRGDVLVAKADKTGAADAYRQAIAKLPKDAPNLKLVEIKLDILGAK